jgi:hypothetical protein
LFLLTVFVFAPLIFFRHDPVSNSLRNFEPWKSNLTAEDIQRKESFVSDPTTQTLPWISYAHESLRNGEFPFWNTRMFSGAPFAANRLTGIFNPIVLLPVWLLPPTTALKLIYFAHAFMAAWFMYLLLKAFGLIRPVALFGSIAYLMQGPYIQWGGICSSDTAYFATCFYYLVRAVDRSDRQGILGFIVSMFLFAITGYPQTVVHSVYIYAFWIVVTGWPSLRAVASRGVALGIMLFCAFLLGAMQNLPTLEFIRESLRSSPEFKYALLEQSPFERYDSPLSLLALFLPRLWGDYLSAQISFLPERILPFYNHAYVGILAATAALFAPIVRRDRNAAFFWALAVIGALFIAWNGLYLAAVRILPGFRISGVKPHFMFFTSVIILGSFVLDSLLRKLKEKNGFERKLNPVILLFSGGTLGILAVLVIAFLRLASFMGEDISRLFELLSVFALLMGASFVLQGYGRGRLTLAWSVTLIIALELVDLIPYHLHYKVSIPAGRTCFTTLSIEFLREKQISDGPFRIFRAQTETFPSNSPMLFHLDEIGGFESSVLSDYAKLFSSVEPEMAANPRALEPPRNADIYSEPFWSFLGVRYIMSSGPDSRIPSSWPAVFKDHIWIYENPNWLPRWFTVSHLRVVDSIQMGYSVAREIDPDWEAVIVAEDDRNLPQALLSDKREFVEGSEPLRSTISIDSYGADEVRLSTETDRDSFLVFSDTYFPGWRAWIDGTEVRIYRTDGVVKGAILPGGKHTVVFAYVPRYYAVGWALVLLGLILIPLTLHPLRKLFDMSWK